MLIKAFTVCPKTCPGSLSGAAQDVDPDRDHYYLRLMNAFAHTLRLRLPVVTTAGSFVVSAK